MNYLNLHIPTTLRSTEFIGCEPIDQATWIKLAAFCAEHENGGVIRDCSKWGDRRWLACCVCTKDEVHRDCPLWTWNSDDLRVKLYPKEREDTAKAMRIAGRRGNQKRWGTTSESLPESPPESQPDIPSPIATRIHKDKGKGKGKGKDKGKGMVRGGEGEPAPGDVEQTPIPPPAERPSWDEWWAYCQLIGYAAEWHAKRKFLAAEADCWRRAGNWQRYAELCRTWWEQDNRPMEPPGPSRSESNGKPSGAEIVAHNDELRRIDAGIASLRSQYEGHQAWTPEDKAKMRKLKERREIVTKILGVIV